MTDQQSLTIAAVVNYPLNTPLTCSVESKKPDNRSIHMSASISAVATDQTVIPISVGMLAPETIPGVSLYERNAAGDSFRLYRGCEHAITVADLDNLRSRGVSKLYVACDERERYQEYLRETLDQMLEDGSVPAERRIGCLNNVVRDVLADVFRRGDLDNRIQQFQELGEKTVSAICRDDVIFSEMHHVLYHDYHTFTHSANVAFNCVLLARSLGIHDRRQLSAIATGGLLHDAGKLDIPAAILNKPGRLDETELKIMRRHPTLGFRKLSHRTELLPAQLMMVYQHHEHVDGNGYPVRCTSREIHEWGRICAVADVFEALTSNRPYRAGYSVSAACAAMQVQSGTAFDEDILSCWMQLVSKK